MRFACAMDADRHTFSGMRAGMRCDVVDVGRHATSSASIGPATCMLLLNAVRRVPLLLLQTFLRILLLSAVRLMLLITAGRTTVRLLL